MKGEKFFIQVKLWIEFVYLTVYYKVYLEFYCCLREVMLHESCLLSCLCGSSEKQLAP